MGVLGCERVEPPHSLAADSERLPAGRQDADVGTGTQQGTGDRGAFVNHVLAIVEHHERIPFRQVPAQGVDRGRPACGLQPEHARSLSRDLGCSRPGGQIDDPHAVDPAGELAASYFSRQTRLAYSSGARHGQKPRPSQRLTYTVEVARPADQRGKGSRDPDRRARCD